jgi:hypothetical protein
MHWHTSFLQVVTTITANGFDRIFGPRLLSWEATATSISLTFASFYLTATAIFVSVQPQACLVLPRNASARLPDSEKSLLSLNEAVSHANHTTGIVKQYPNISTGKTAEC